MEKVTIETSVRRNIKSVAVCSIFELVSLYLIFSGDESDADYYNGITGRTIGIISLIVFTCLLLFFINW